ncbi:family 2 encapsulin nanocompartment cargo protein terpene cyclase [Phytomonospora endophytica]|uniref:Terpene synthase n=1 Tax=Phytomonospora endophytica TaxID=714109 RepID=A0A841FQM7_9ACTN|nr:family 2 encapsulin nanocompartment cargo protein terpene cyclase [Phytomonospora endophytica]MBB6035862.1 2-methylisoborneol synthase [Phytomonospora endophytica]GIG71143.1 terpene synthase [Phytomonospora endophytica]
MSLLSRAATPIASRETSDLVVGALLRTGPGGIGTSALRPAGGHTATAESDTPEPTRREPEIYCPEALRDDVALGDEVNERLVAWAERIGIYPGRVEEVRGANFGRLVMLTHPDSDDPDRLTAAGKCALAEWATDDHYCDDETQGSDLTLLGARLGVANAVVDPAHLPPRYAADLERAVGRDPVLRALRGAFEHLARYADIEQVNRLRQEIASLFVGYDTEGSWRASERVPPVWEYLVNRQDNSFLPCMALVDVVGGYRLPAAEYYDPRVRRAVSFAASASVIVNDLYSTAKESDASGLVDFNLPMVIAVEENCSTEEAVRRSVAVHDDLVRTFEAESAFLSATGSPRLGRFLAAVWAWLGGNREWHRGTARYSGA